MNDLNPAHRIDTLEALEALYGAPIAASLAKEADHVHPHYRRLIEASPFAVLATAGPGGLDASPRGDPAGFVRVHDEKTLLLPDRRGNNRIDSLSNILHDPRVALLFLLPGMGEALRVNGRASIHADPDLLSGFAIDGKAPRTVLKIVVDTVFFQCARAILRSRLWDPAAHVDRASLPSTGTILAALSRAEIDGEQYDAGLAARLRDSMY
ncbi:pyridoxamine 5'-phosphate oxidase family protein [Noviherbaspirillum sp. 1P10PC]|uniref:pyridoxamine 5'-phosphate oxidase family protein n=1 Tax=Noviherbaspirillum sp. 1P10PC TaxID=3132292 RepID=UPI0039A1C5C4